MEIEAKLAVPNRSVHRSLLSLRSIAGYALAPADTVRVTDHYLDTEDGDLLAAGYACRLRAEGDAVLATLKGLGGATGAVHRRAEIEVALADRTTDPAAWPAGPARDLALQLTGGRSLAPLFVLEQRRSRADVLDGVRRVAQLSLDAVRAVVGRRPALYYELEVELAPDGHEGDLAAIAGELQSAYGLMPEGRSKFERAMATLRARGTAVEGRLTEPERRALVGLASGEDGELARRAAVVLGWGEGLPTREIAARAGLSGGRVRFWLRAFRAERMGIFGAEMAATPRPRRAAAAAVSGARRPRPPVEHPGEGLSQPTVVEFCRTHCVDMAHARFVADRAGELFILLRPAHGLPRKRRRLIQDAALLANVGARQDDAHPQRAGRDLILAQPLREVSTSDRLALAAIVALQRGKLRPDREPVLSALEPKQREHVLTLAALLRMAEALDFSRSQSTQIVGAEGVDTGRCELFLAGPAAEVDALQATGAAAGWCRRCGQELVFIGIKPEAVDAGPADGLQMRSAVAPEPAVQPALAASPVLADEPMSEAGRKIMLLHFTRMLANEAGTRAGKDIEALHDMRVATRRMRAACSAFAAHFAAATLGAFSKGMRRAGRTLGAVRDLDVLIEHAVAHRAGLPAEDQPALEPLLEDWRTRREVARRHLIAYLDGPAYRRFVTDFGVFLTTPGAGAVTVESGDPAPHQVRHIVPALVLARYANVRAYEAVLDGAPLATYHLLRVDCKRLRYLLEFFREVLGPQAPGVIEQVTALQDLLGELQDATVAEGLIADFLRRQGRRKKGSEAVSLAGPEGYLRAQQERQAALLARFPTAWAPIAGPAFRRALALSVAVL